MINHESQLKGAQANRERARARSERVLARIAEGATHAELATELGVNVSTVRTIVLRARRRLGVTARPRHYEVACICHDGVDCGATVCYVCQPVRWPCSVWVAEREGES